MRSGIARLRPRCNPRGLWRGLAEAATRRRRGNRDRGSGKHSSRRSSGWLSAVRRSRSRRTCWWWSGSRARRSMASCSRSGAPRSPTRPRRSSASTSERDAADRCRGDAGCRDQGGRGHRREGGGRGYRRHRAVRARDICGEGGEIQHARAGHGAGGLRAAARAAAIEARRVREYGERQRPVRRGVVRSRPRHRGGDADGRRKVFDALRRSVRRRVHHRERRRRSRREGLDPRGVRLREEGGLGLVPSGKGCCRRSTRCSTTTATSRAAWSPAARRRTASRRRCSASARCASRRCRRTRKCARSISSASRSSGGSNR